MTNCVASTAKPQKGPFEVDHVIPRSLGGMDIIGNLATSCRDCNRGKSAHALPPDVLRDVLQRLRPMKRAQIEEGERYFTGIKKSDGLTWTQKYMRDIGGRMGRGTTLEDAVAELLKRHPENARDIEAARIAVLEKRAK